MSLSYVVDGETELDSELFNPIIDRVNGDAGPLANMRAGVANVLDFGPVGTGEHDDTAYLLDAVASNADGLYFPPGLYLVSDSLVIGSCRAWFGHHWRTTTIRVTDAISSALILGASTDAIDGFFLSNITLDGNYDNVSQNVHAIQITNGNEPWIENARFLNWGGGGILFQGLTGSSGTPDATVKDCMFDGTGLADSTTGHAIHFKDGSVRPRATGNRIKNAKGGMGIAGSGSGTTGYPTDGVYQGNTIRMAASTTGFEAIGLQDGCVRATIAGNQIVDSQDNGISCSAGYSSVTGNVIDGTLNHGIYTAGDYVTISGNYVRNVGQDGLASYGGITLDGSAHCTVVGNTVVDDQGSSTTDYGVKIHSSGGYNLVGHNNLSGYSSANIGDSPATTDSILIADQVGGVGAFVTDYLYINTRIASQDPPLFIGSDAVMGSRFQVGSAVPATAGQVNFTTNVTSRPTQVISKLTSQTADFVRYEDESGNELASLDVNGKFMAKAGIGVGNSAAATTPGSVIKKIEVFDEAGTSLGFLPVYGSIS